MAHTTNALSIEALALAAIATACRVESDALDAATPLESLNMDSLTLVWIAGCVETECGVTLTTGDTLRLFAARTVGELIAELAGAAEAGPSAYRLA